MYLLLNHLGSGMPPILDMIKINIPVAISINKSGSADNQNMLSAARLASQYQKALHQDAKVLNSEEVLRRVTRKPAEMWNFRNRKRCRFHCC